MNDDGPRIPPTAKRLNLHKPKQPPSPDRQHYGGLHQKFSKARIRQFPLCEYALEGCTGWSQEGHHLCYPATSVEQYRALCRACHQRVTIEEKRRRDG